MSRDIKLLAIECASDNCSVGLHCDGQNLVEESPMARGHAEALLPMVDRLLARTGMGASQLDAIAFGCGPGSFTGLRVAASSAQGLAFGLDLPVIAISSLAATAQVALMQASAHTRPDGLAVALDARLGEVYYALFAVGDDNLVTPMGVEQVCAAATVATPPAPAKPGWLGVGPGWAAHGEALRARLDPWLSDVDAQRLPSAGGLLPLAVASWQRGELLSPEQALPVYLRNRVASLPGGQA